MLRNNVAVEHFNTCHPDVLARSQRCPSKSQKHSEPGQRGLKLQLPRMRIRDATLSSILADLRHFKFTHHFLPFNHLAAPPELFLCICLPDKRKMPWLSRPRIIPKSDFT